MSAPEDVEGLIARIPEGYTAGPWRWEVNRKSQIVSMCGGEPAGRFDKTVLDFVRWGMSRAAPRFWFWKDSRHWSEEPKRADALAQAVSGREHHADWFADVDHPDARLIALAPELASAVRALSAQVASQREEIAILHASYETVKAALHRAEERSQEAEAVSDQAYGALIDCQRQVYVCGSWRCPKCHFILQQMVLDAHSGEVAAQDDPGEPCPNCASPLWRVTWRQEAEEMMKRVEETAGRAAARDATIAEQAARIERLTEALRHIARGGAVEFRPHSFTCGCPECLGEDADKGGEK